MDPDILRDCLKEYIDDLIAGQRSVNPRFRKLYHISTHEMKYDTWKQMVAGVQKWTLHYFILTAKAFSIPPHDFLAELMRRYQTKSKP
jgi:hypothetical protein